MTCSAERDWAIEEFGDAALGNRRRTDRLVAMASGVAAAPAGRITAVFADPASREGAFRFVENEHVEPRAIAEAAFRACARRAETYSYVFVPVDGTSLNISDWKRTKGLGIVGARFVGATGLQVMSAMAVAPDGAPLGLCGLQFWARRGRSRRRGRHDLRKVASKETNYWLQTLRCIEENFSRLASTCTPWFQLDRGADAWPVLEMCVDQRLLVTVRAARNRALWNGGDLPEKYLWGELERGPVRGTKRLEVPTRAGRPGRTATLSVRYADVVLDLHNAKGRHRRPAAVTAVLVREVGRIPDAEERIEWLLLTTHPVGDFGDALAVIDGYASRWTIEDFHRAWKSGCCQVETTQLRSSEHIQRWATILAAVAVRVMRLAKLARTEPELPATVELRQSEIDAIILTRRRTGYSPGDVPTIGEAVTWLAEVGGYTGKSSGGPPGAAVLSRGILRIQALADYLELKRGDDEK
jgi:hypothetical protein